MDLGMETRLRENGIDVEPTLERFMQNEQLFFKFLKKFPEDKNYEGLKESLAKGDREQAFIHAHTLKGVAANLGVNTLLEPLVPIVENLRKSSTDNLESNMEKLEQNYKKVCQFISSL